MKVQKSSEECAKHNQVVQAEIDLGLSEAWEPSDEIRKSEAAAAAREAAGFKLMTDKMAVLKAIDPDTDGRKVHGIEASIDAVYSGSTTYSSGYHSGWKLTLGSRYNSSGNCKRIIIGDGTTLGINTRQLNKAQDFIAEERERNAIRSAQANAAMSDQQRTVAFIKANPDFCTLVGCAQYNNGETIHYGSGMNRRTIYQTAFIMLADGNLKMGSEILTVGQWTELFTLRAEHAAAIKALKASFKPATATVNA